MESSLIKISDLYHDLILLYGLGENTTPDHRIKSLFGSYLQRRITLANYIHRHTFHTPETIGSSDHSTLSYERILDLILAKEEQLISKYEQYLHKCNGDSLHYRILLMQKNELDAGCRNLKILTSYYRQERKSA